MFKCILVSQVSIQVAGTGYISQIKLLSADELLKRLMTRIYTIDILNEVAGSEMQ